MEQQLCQPNKVIHLRLTEIETRESILEHIKDIAEGRLWKSSGHKSLQQYCEIELGYSPLETRELLSKIGEIITSDQLVSNNLDIQFRIDILRNWRKEKSKQTGIAAYRIVLNRTLLELAERSPKNRDELLEIYGIGEIKAAMYGTELLSLLNETAPKS